MDVPETRYARAPDGCYIAYQVVGDGPIDLVWQFDFFGNVDVDVGRAGARSTWLRDLASFSRLILHDRRGTGLSSRNVALPNLETRVDDLRLVLDAAGVEQAVLGGAMEGGAPNALFAAAEPERVRSLVWWGASARSLWAPDYPWGVTPTTRDASARRSRTHWGTAAFGDAFREVEASAGTPDRSAASSRSSGRLSRHTGTPDVAPGAQRDLERDRRPKRAPRRARPALLLWLEDDAHTRGGRVRGVAAPVVRTASDPRDERVRPRRADRGDGGHPVVHRGRSSADRPRHDPVDGALHRHRRLDEDPGRTRRPRVEGARAQAPRRRARGARTLARASRTTRRATASTPRSTAPHARSVARWR